MEQSRPGGLWHWLGDGGEMQIRFRFPEDRSNRQTLYFLPFETVKPIHGAH